MKKLACLLPILMGITLVFSSFSSTPAAQAPEWNTKIDPWIVDTAADGETEFLVYLTEQADLSHAAALSTKLEKGAYVYETLTRVAENTQGPVLQSLEGMGVEHRSYWVANMIWVKGDMSVVQALAQRPDVAHLYANPWVKMDEPKIDESAANAPGSPQVVEWNINHVGAPQVWAAGYTGQGAVIGGQDTGYDWDHPALKNQYRGWSGVTADHDYNWHDAIHSGGGTCGANSTEPCDDSQHGTHTMGTMVGDDGGSNQVGMAPGARWIGCRNMNVGDGTPATYSECYQWFIAPTRVDGSDPDPLMAPDVINNSWSCPLSEGCTDPNVMLTVVNNVRAAGILTVHSAGNEGSACSTVAQPGAIYEASFSVGATNISDVIAGFSSRGPVTVDGSNRRKPDISAPGVNIRSTIPGGGYAGGWQGTSMAAPHVAGLVGLLISIDPSLAGQVDTMETLIEQTALPRTTTQGCGGDTSTQVPNNVYGWGRIDAWAMYQDMNPALALNKTPSQFFVRQGEILTYTLEIDNLSTLLPTTNVVLTDVLPADVDFVDATAPYTLVDETVKWEIATLGAGASQSVELVVQVPLTATGNVVNAEYGVRSDTADPISGPPIQTPIIPVGLTLEKTAPTIGVPGEALTYTFYTTNLSTLDTVHNVVLTDVLPTHTTFISATQPYTRTGDLLTWENPSLGTKITWEVALVLRVDEGFAGAISNYDYAVRGDGISPVSGPPVTTQIFDLNLEKTAPERIDPGALLTYSLTVTNQHPLSSTHNLLLTDRIPTGADFVSATSPYTLENGSVSWPRTELGTNGVWAVELVVRTPITATGTIDNLQYSVASDDVPVPVTGAAVSTILNECGIEPPPDQTTPASPGSELTFTYILTNTGNITDTFDITVDSSQGWGVVDKSEVTIGPGKSATLLVTVTVPETAANGDLEETVVTATSRSDPTVTTSTIFTTMVVIETPEYKTYLPITMQKNP